jgi:hypothetical protein
MTFLSHNKIDAFPGRRNGSPDGGVYILNRFEQLKQPGERLPGVGAVGTYSTLKPSIWNSVDIEQKANHQPRRW